MMLFCIYRHRSEYQDLSEKSVDMTWKCTKAVAVFPILTRRGVSKGIYCCRIP
jgi:hypothetical protein